MERTRHEYLRWLVVAIFAAAMAWAEASVVYDLRTMTDRIQPFQQNPLPMEGALEWVELVREGATLVMILTVGLLAGRTWRSRAAHSAIAFGIWDILYYVFLKMICGWPHSLFDWDILFLLPLPWWGPVLAPVCIALLMIVWGARTLIDEVTDRSVATCSWRSRCLGGLGSALALYVFMSDSLLVAAQGADALRHMLPTTFNWPLFCVALALMAVPAVDGMFARPQPARVLAETE
ncbi:MAG TPA: hypothetical protein VHU82_09145 [Vicinamibacterales bacterium]|jgi:hypothetical protein|nr:hypothetical protein [Vicinamibacterales bacterium]